MSGQLLATRGAVLPGLKACALLRRGVRPGLGRADRRELVRTRLRNRRSAGYAALADWAEGCTSPLTDHKA